MRGVPSLKIRCRHLSFLIFLLLFLFLFLYFSLSLSLSLRLFLSSLFASSSSSFHKTSIHRHSIPNIMRTSELILSQNSSQTRSWRRTVARAVASAKWAVELDSKNTDPMGALDAYMESVRHLRSILARLERHGVHSEATRLATIVCRRRRRPRSRIERLC
jgi:hypothetical protein